MTRRVGEFILDKVRLNTEPTLALFNRIPKPPLLFGPHVKGELELYVRNQMAIRGMC